MGLESATYVSQLVTTNPTSTDPKSQGDDHLRLIKTVLQNTFPGFSGTALVTGTDGGSANSYLLTPSSALPAYSTDMIAVFTPSATNTGASTLNISSLGSKNIKDIDGNDLTSGDLVSGSTYVAIYNGTEFRLAGVTKNYIDQLSFSSALPAQSTNAGKALVTDGTNASWQNFRLVEDFTANGTWTKPSDITFVNVQVWGGGAGGASGATAFGGGGGAYNTYTFLASDLPSTVSVTVAASVSGGVNGQDSSFGSYLYGYGGYAGSSTNGGGGGGVLPGGQPYSEGTNTTKYRYQSLGGGKGAGISSNVSPQSGDDSVYGGGGGGGYSTFNTLLGSAGSSIFGGGAGGSYCSTASPTTTSGGTSRIGGAGGAGNAVTGVAGTAPGGGGGAGGTTGGAGARGLVRVISW